MMLVELMIVLCSLNFLLILDLNLLKVYQVER